MTWMRAGSFAALLGGLGVMAGVLACVPQADGGDATAGNGPGQAVDEVQCEADGGTLVSGYLGPICAMPTPDAGQACTDGAQCTALCLAQAGGQSGTCSPLTPAVGCYEVLEQGQIVGICID